jgi:hypothetical protein
MLDQTHSHDGAVLISGWVNGALTEARRLLADTETALRVGTPDADDVSAVVTGTHDLTTTLAGLVQALMDHMPTLATTHGQDVSSEILADLRALHGCLTTGALLLAPALDDLHVTVPTATPGPDKHDEIGEA